MASQYWWALPICTWSRRAAVLRGLRARAHPVVGQVAGAVRQVLHGGVDVGHQPLPPVGDRAHPADVGVQEPLDRDGHRGPAPPPGANAG